jgi:3-dehydroquinate dehydratase II
MTKLYILNGPNLNLLGTREPEVYGTDTLETIQTLCQKTSALFELQMEFFQTNFEGEMLEKIYHAKFTDNAEAIIINPAAWTHTSVALRDSLTGVAIPFWEVHITNVHKREAFRHHSFLSDVAQGVICGFGIRGYDYAIREVAQYLSSHR